MIIIIFALLYYLVFHDAQFIEKKSPLLFKTHLKFSPWIIATLSSLLFPVFLPSYVWRRYQLQKKLSLSDSHWFAFDAVGVLLTWLAFVLNLEVLAVLFDLIHVPIKDSLGSVLLFVMLQSYLMIVLIHRVSHHFEGGWKQTVSWIKPPQGLWPMILLGVGMAVAFASLGGMALVHRTISPTTPMVNLMDQNQSPGLLILFMVMALCVAPWVEEIVFRGYFFQAVFQSRGRVVAVVLISFIFCLLHVPQYWGDWLAVLVVGLVGVNLTLLRYKTDSVIPGIWMHYTYNVLVVLIPACFVVIQNPMYIQYLNEQEQISFDKKEQWLVQAIENNPGFSEAYYSLAQEYYKDGQLAPALKYIETALVLNPGRKIYTDLKDNILHQE